MTPLRIAIVTGELSGELLALPLMSSLQAQYPAVQFMGIGSHAMVQVGFQQWYDSRTLSVMGFNIVGALYRLWSMRQQVYRRLLATPPDVFIGIDSPDFNFGLEKKLKRAGIPVIHLVSPSLWAWRKKRLYTLHHIMDRMVFLFPFERTVYERAQVAHSYVPHPVFRTIPLYPDRAAARQALGITSEAQVLALLPGSRFSELNLLLPIYLQAFMQLKTLYPHLYCLLPAATPDLYRYCLSHLEQLPIHQAASVFLMQGQAQAAMTAADVVVVASGTATLECALLKRPMVICYDLKPLSRWIARRLVKTPWVGLANIFMQKAMFPELLLEHCTPDGITKEVKRYLDHPEDRKVLEEILLDWHKTVLSDEQAFGPAFLRVLQEHHYLPSPS